MRASNFSREIHDIEVMEQSIDDAGLVRRSLAEPAAFAGLPAYMSVTARPCIAMWPGGSVWPWLRTSRPRSSFVPFAVVSVVDSSRTARCRGCLASRSYEETAAALDVPVGTIRSRIFRARQRLAAALGERSAVTSPEYRLSGDADA